MTDQVRKANFFLIGAAKAGTTSLDRLLRSHSEVYLSSIKEPCHFCPDINEQIRAEAARQATIRLDKYLNAGCPVIVHQYIVERRQDYARLFATAPDSTKILGECSTHYMISIQAPTLVHAYNPQAKILAILRDPVERIRSHYDMDQRTGLERRGLAECLDEEIALGASANLGNCRFYLGTSDYLPQIARWQALFDYNFMAINFDDLVNDTDAVLSRVLQFLGLSNFDRPVSLGKENSGGVQARFPTLDRTLYRLGIKPMLGTAVRNLVPDGPRAKLKQFYMRQGAKPVIEGQAWAQFPQVQALQERFRACLTTVTSARYADVSRNGSS